jgi:hypothetical protein
MTTLRQANDVSPTRLAERDRLDFQKSQDANRETLTL